MLSVDMWSSMQLTGISFRVNSFFKKSGHSRRQVSDSRRFVSNMYACASRFGVAVRCAINSDASKRRGTEGIVTNYLGAPDD